MSYSKEELFLLMLMWLDARGYLKEFKENMLKSLPGSRKIFICSDISSCFGWFNTPSGFFEWDKRDSEWEAQLSEILTSKI
jgi:hypothetical protein